MGVGSSPQVRGARAAHDLVEQLLGLIPAGAGRTGVIDAEGVGDRAHPRRCGAHGEEVSGLPVPEGSSPQVRGALAELGRREVVLGLIPAGAGRTCSVSGQ